MQESTITPDWNKIRNVSAQGFEQAALEVFRFQYFNCEVYRSFCDANHRGPGTVKDLASIPFLPIGFFKTHHVTTTEFSPEVVFESSGTTGSINSRHLVKETHIYEDSFVLQFEKQYGNVKDMCLVALLPSYLERSNSSLVYMMDYLIKKSGNPDSGFYLYEHEKLHALVSEYATSGKPVILLGVTYALLDFRKRTLYPCHTA